MFDKQLFILKGKSHFFKFQIMYKIIDPDTFRSNINKRIKEIIMSFDKTMDLDLCQTVSKNIEIGIFNYTIQIANDKNIIKKWENKIFVQLYIDRLRSIYTNLENKSFLQKIVNGAVEIEKIAFMTHQEFDPEKWKELLEQKVKIDASKLADTIEASTDVYLCRKCKTRKCTYTSVQIRSSDEPMTIFVTCLTCGKNWTC